MLSFKCDKIWTFPQGRMGIKYSKTRLFPETSQINTPHQKEGTLATPSYKITEVKKEIKKQWRIQEDAPPPTGPNSFVFAERRPHRRSAPPQTGNRGSAAEKAPKSPGEAKYPTLLPVGFSKLGGSRRATGFV